MPRTQYLKMSPSYVRPAQARLKLPESLEEAQWRVNLLTKAKSLFEQQSSQSVRSHRYRALLNHLEVAKEDLLCYIEKELFGHPFSRKHRYLEWYNPEAILDHYPFNEGTGVRRVRKHEKRSDKETYRPKKS